MKFTFICFVAFFLVLVFLLLCFMLSMNAKSMDLEKNSPFECGFQPFSSMGISFSMPFFIISLMFLLFDVEILLLSVFPVGGIFLGSVKLTTFVVILIIFLSTLYEWSKGVLLWF